MKKINLIITLILSVEIYAQYVDLGLPSGTLWKTINEDGFFNYTQANVIYKDQLPCYGDWRELIDNCVWKWTSDGYNIIGKNGNQIYLPAAGGQACDGEWEESGLTGSYWTSSPGENESGWKFWILPDNRMSFGVYPVSNLSSVRLIKTRHY